MTARNAALRLVRSPATREAIEALAPLDGGRVVAFGDSHTAATGSWAEILAEAFRSVPATRGVELVNLGVPGDTTVHLVSRFVEVMSADPDLLVVLVGTNDARRHGTAAETMLVSDRDTARNLTLLRRLAREETRANAVFVTPPPVLEDRVRRAPAFLEERVSWREADVARKAALVSATDSDAIDSRSIIRAEVRGHFLADGLHLSARGQERLAGWIARGLSRPELPSISLARQTASALVVSDRDADR
jgi:lysophospholipase L1-like esterase